LAVIGITLIVMEAGVYWKIHEINRWPIVKDGGTVIDSYLETTYDYQTYSVFFVSEAYTTYYYRTRVAFRYQYGGKTYTSMTYSYYEPWDTNPMYARVEADRFTPGRKVNVRVNPSNPSEAYILNKPYNEYSVLLIGIFFAVIGIYTAYYNYAKNGSKK
jgi:hypothetical protein